MELKYSIRGVNMKCVADKDIKDCCNQEGCCNECGYEDCHEGCKEWDRTEDCKCCIYAIK